MRKKVVIRGDKYSQYPTVQMNVVGGPKPYLWIGNQWTGSKDDVRFVGSVSDSQLRKLRDEITKALGRARQGDTQSKP